MSFGESYRSKGKTKAENSSRELSRSECRRLRRPSLIPPGVLTVEAAMVLPVFLMAMGAFLSLFDLLLFQLKLQSAMNDAVVRASAYSYAMECLANGFSGEEDLEGTGEFDGGILKTGITAVWLKTAVADGVGQRMIERAHILGGPAGLVVLQSRFPDEKGAIDLVVSYEAKIPFLPGSAGGILCSQRCRCYAWSGTKRWSEEKRQQEEEKEDPIVYVTEHGTVYHTSLNCTYLNASVESVFPSDIQKKRNDSGAIYYACERCGHYKKGLFYYITRYGDRYHTVLNCPSLERNIRQIHLSETGGMPCCSKCAKEKGKQE